MYVCIRRIEVNAVIQMYDGLRLRSTTLLTIIYIHVYAVATLVYICCLL